MNSLRCILMPAVLAFFPLMDLPVTGAAGDAVKPIGKGAETLPIFDAHVHYKEPAWAPYPPGTVLELTDKSGVAMALVSSTPGEGTIKF